MPAATKRRGLRWQRRGSLAWIGISAAFGLAVVFVSIQSPPGGPNRYSSATQLAKSQAAPPLGASGEATAGGVSVQGAEVTMGRVPLNVTVKPQWVLRNTGAETVTVGYPDSQIVRGCCPGQFSIDKQQLGPGEEATLVFPLRMHAGMDGMHDFRIRIPIKGSTGENQLALGVTGDFRN